jgi:hypothetical protein
VLPASTSSKNQLYCPVSWGCKLLILMTGCIVEFRPVSRNHYSSATVGRRSRSIRALAKSSTPRVLYRRSMLSILLPLISSESPLEYHPGACWTVTNLAAVCRGKPATYLQCASTPRRPRSAAPSIPFAHSALRRASLTLSATQTVFPLCSHLSSTPPFAPPLRRSLIIQRIHFPLDTGAM